jgi:hypothetical protein
MDFGAARILMNCMMPGSRQAVDKVGDIARSVGRVKSVKDNSIVK